MSELMGECVHEFILGQHSVFGHGLVIHWLTVFNLPAVRPDIIISSTYHSLAVASVDNHYVVDHTIGVRVVWAEIEAGSVRQLHGLTCQLRYAHVAVIILVSSSGACGHGAVFPVINLGLTARMPSPVCDHTHNAQLVIRDLIEVVV